MEVEKIRQNRGFTMAELLIVVAIIGVLVAVSIPVFSNQLEKARESTDEANIRSAYAQVQAAALLGNDTIAKDTTDIFYKAAETPPAGSGKWVYKAKIHLKQQQDGWTGDPPDIGGMTPVSGKSTPKAKQWALIVYDESNTTDPTQFSFEDTEPTL